MVKTKDLYQIYEQRPEEERTNDKYFRTSAGSWAQYLNALASNYKLSISVSDGYYVKEQPTFIVTKRNSKYFIARVYLANDGWHAFFDKDNPVRCEVSVVNSIFNAIDDMMEKL